MRRRIRGQHLAKGERVEVGDVGDEIDEYHQQHPVNQRAGNVALRLFDLAGDHRYVGPSLVGPQRGEHRGAESAAAWRSSRRCRGLFEIRPTARGEEKSTEDDDPDPGDLRHRHCPLHSSGGLHTTRVDGAEEENHRDGDYLLNSELPLHDLAEYVDVVTGPNGAERYEGAKKRRNRRRDRG